MRMHRVVSFVLLWLLVLAGALPVAAAPAAPTNGELKYGITVRDKVTDAAGDRWTFEGLEGDIVRIAMVSGRLDTYLELYGPDGDFLVYDDDSGGDGDALIQRYVLPVDGTYIIVAKGYSGATGPYTLSLEAMQAEFLAYGDVVDAELADATNGDLWVFYGNVGDVVTIAMESEDFDTYLELYAPGSTYSLAYNDDADGTNAVIAEQLLSQEGYYIIVASGYGMEEGLEYTLSIDGTAAELLSYGDSIEGELTDEDGDRWLFYGEAGDVVNITMESDEVDAYLDLYGPENYIITSADNTEDGDTNAYIVDYALTTSGIHTIVARSADGDTGAYILTLDGTPVQTLAYGDTVSGELAGGETQSWAFDGQAGDLVRIALTSEDFDSYLELYGPNNTYLTSDDDSGPDSSSLIIGITLQTTGRHIIHVSAWNEEEEGAYDLTVEAVTEDTIAYGESVRGRLRQFADFYTFTGEVGDTVDISLETDAFDAYIELYGPDGYYLTSGNGTDNAVITGYILTTAGRYTIRVRDYDEQGRGTYTLTLEGSGPELLAYGDSVTGEIVDLTGNVWAFEGAAGDLVAIAMSSEVIDTYLELQDPDGTVIASNDDRAPGNTDSLIQLTLPRTGRYIIRAQGLDTPDVGPYTLTLGLGAAVLPTTEPGVVTLPEEVPAVVSIDGLSCRADGAYFILAVDGTALDNVYYYEVMLHVSDDGTVAHAFPLLDEPLAWPFEEPITIFLGDSSFNLTDLETLPEAAQLFADEWDLWSGLPVSTFGVAMNNTADQPPMRYLVATTSSAVSLSFQWQIEDTDEVLTAELASLCP